MAALAGTSAALLLGGGSAAAQEANDELVVYQREVFRYPGGGRPDPFRSLLGAGELGIRLEDITLTGVVHHSDPARSVAVLQQKGTQRPIHARIGERLGPIRLLAIQPGKVEVLVEELGVARRDVIVLDSVDSEGDAR
jgi:hypothetical protein